RHDRRGPARDAVEQVAGGQTPGAVAHPALRASAEVRSRAAATRVVGGVRSFRSKAATLEPRVDPHGHRRPHVSVALDERIDLLPRQLEALLPQLRERLERSRDEAITEILVREQAAD